MNIDELEITLLTTEVSLTSKDSRALKAESPSCDPCNICMPDLEGPCVPDIPCAPDAPPPPPPPPPPSEVET